MSQKICASCTKEDDFQDVAKAVTLPEWLKETNFVREFLESMENHTSVQQHSKTCLYKIHFVSRYRNRKILLWATTSPQTITINDAKSAYGDFRNHQVGKVNADGDVKVMLDMPQLYYVKERGKKKIYPRHFHFAFYNERKKKWDGGQLVDQFRCLLRQAASASARTLLLEHEGAACAGMGAI